MDSLHESGEQLWYSGHTREVRTKMMFIYLEYRVVKRALEVNDRKKVYLQLISIYKSSRKYQYIDKQLCKKFNTSLKIWSGYLEFLFEMREMKASKESP